MKIEVIHHFLTKLFLISDIMHADEWTKWTSVALHKVTNSTQDTQIGHKPDNLTMDNQKYTIDADTKKNIL
jgi:hypothetical protein